MSHPVDVIRSPEGTMTRVVLLDSIDNGSDHMMDGPSVGDTELSHVFSEVSSNSRFTVHPGNDVEVVMDVKDDTVGNGLTILLDDVVVD